MNMPRVIIWLWLLLAFGRGASIRDMQFALRHLLDYISLKQPEQINWFISELMDTESSEHFQEFFNIVHRNTSISQAVVTNSRTIRSLQNCSKYRYLVVVVSTGAEDPIMAAHNQLLRNHNVHVNFVILVRAVQHFAVAERLLHLLHRNHFYNSYLHVGYPNGSNEVLSFRPYPKFAVLSGLASSKTTWSAWGLNCLGYEFQTSIRLNLPDVFWYINEENGVERRGTAFYILSLFLERINASLVPYGMASVELFAKPVNMKYILELIRAKKILISAHSYALFNADDKVGKSYSLLLVNWCLMVPIRNTASAFYYPVEPFQMPVWLLLIFAYLCFATVDYMWLVWEKRKNPLNISAAKNSKCPANIKVLLYASAFFHTFFVSILYTSLLGSILTVTLFRDNIISMEDLIRTNISTMIIDYELEFLLSQNLNLSDKFLQLLMPVDPETFFLHQSTLNQSYAYFVTTDKWDFLNQQQQYLRPALFKLTDICFGTYQLTFPMEVDSPIWLPLASFILYVHTSGLLFYHWKISFGEALSTGYMRYFQARQAQQGTAHLSHLSMVFLFLIIMDIVAIIVFVAEYRSSRRRKAK